MERQKILEMYLAEVQAELEGETPSLLFIRGLTKLCNTMLDEEEKSRNPGFIEKTLNADEMKTVVSALTKYQYKDEKPDDTQRTRGRRYWLSDSEVQRIQNLYDMGKSQAEIMRITGYSRSTISRRLKGYLPKSSKEPGKGHIDWFRDLAVQGFGVKAISDRTGYTEEIVRKYLGGNADENADT